MTGAREVFSAENVAPAATLQLRNKRWIDGSINTFAKSFPLRDLKVLNVLKIYLTVAMIMLTVCSH